MEIDLKQKSISAIADKVTKEIGKREKWVSTEEAAEILRVSPKYLRSIKHKFNFKKTGNSNQSHLLFDIDSLI